MTPKERFDAAMRFEKPDRPFFFPTIGFWRETIQRWHGEGLPKYVNEITGYLYFNFEYPVPLPNGSHEQPGFFPPFRRKVLEEKDEYRIVRDWSGKTFKEFKDKSSSIPLFLESPVKNMDDFRNLKWRLRPEVPGRAVNPAFDAVRAWSKISRLPFGAMYSGLFGFHRHLLGDEELMVAYFDAPDLVHAMSRAWARLVRETTRRQRKHYGVSFLSFWEDMCYVNGPLVSPRIFREFMTPYYKQVIDDAKDQGIEFFGVDTDGDCTLLIPLFKEVGVNWMWPFEVQSGMDVLKVRENHPDLVIMGGLDKMVLAESREAIEAEVMRKVPPLLEKGGYIPAIDHNVPPEVPLENFKFFLKLLKSLW